MKFLKIFFLLFPFLLFSQFQIPESEKKVVIPFKLVNNLVFIPIIINGVELTFLLDTGVSETLLFSIGENEIEFYKAEKAIFTGLGENISIEGLKTENNIVQFSDNFKDYNHTIYVILNEEVNFSTHVGIPVHGIIGYHFFKDFPIEIDHLTKKITVYNDQKYFKRKSRNFDSFPITLEYRKPYITGGIEMINDIKPSKLLIDTGNSDAIWLFPTLIKDFIYNRPNIDDFLGRGFNGDIFGKRSRIHFFHLGNFAFEKPIASMPDEYSIQHLNLAKDRKGSIGNEIMRRFTTLYDYKNNRLLLKKNRNFKEPFRFNMSGLDFQHVGSTWEKESIKMVSSDSKSSSPTIVFNNFQYKLVLKPIFSIAGVRKDSPAFKAGLQKDDVLIKINGAQTSNMSLEELMRMMTVGEGKHFNFEIKRNGETLVFSFYLEDPIPYQENP